MNRLLLILTASLLSCNDPEISSQLDRALEDASKPQVPGGGEDGAPKSQQTPFVEAKIHIPAARKNEKYNKFELILKPITLRVKRDSLIEDRESKTFELELYEKVTLPTIMGNLVVSGTLRGVIGNRWDGETLRVREFTLPHAQTVTIDHYRTNYNTYSRKQTFHLKEGRLFIGDYFYDTHRPEKRSSLGAEIRFTGSKINKIYVGRSNGTSGYLELAADQVTLNLKKSYDYPYFRLQKAILSKDQFLRIEDLRYYLKGGSTLEYPRDYLYCPIKATIARLSNPMGHYKTMALVPGEYRFSAKGTSFCKPVGEFELEGPLYLGEYWWHPNGRTRFKFSEPIELSDSGAAGRFWEPLDFRVGAFVFTDYQEFIRVSRNSNDQQFLLKINRMKFEKSDDRKGQIYIAHKYLIYQLYGFRTIVSYHPKFLFRRKGEEYKEWSRLPGSSKARRLGYCVVSFDRYGWPLHLGPASRKKRKTRYRPEDIKEWCAESPDELYRS